MSAIIEVERLWKGSDKFVYSKQAERVVFECLGQILGTNLVELSQDYCPGYDAIMSDGTHELKIYSGPVLYMEYTRGDNITPSGISTSTADYVVTVALGYSKDRDGCYVPVGKVRRVTQGVMRDVMMHKVEKHGDRAARHFPTSDDGPGSDSVIINVTSNNNDFVAADADDGWLADIAVVPHANNVFSADGRMVKCVAYDFSRVLKVNRCITRQSGFTHKGQV